MLSPTCFWLNLLIYLFIAVLGLSGYEQTFSSCSLWASYCSDFSCCRVWSPGQVGFSSCSMALESSWTKD